MSFDWKNEYHRYSHYFFNLKKITQSNKARSFAWISLTVFTITFFLIVAIQPTLITIARLNKEIKDKKEASSQLQKKIDTIIAAQEEFAKNIDNSQLLDEALPEKSQFPLLAYYFENLANNEGVTLNSLSFGKIEIESKNGAKAQNKTADSLNFQVGVSGDYLKLKNFLNNLEATRRLLKSENVFFTQVKVETGKEISLLISGEAYFLKN